MSGGLSFRCWAAVRARSGVEFKLCDRLLLCRREPASDLGARQFGVILVLLDPEILEPLQDGTDAAAAAPAKRVENAPARRAHQPREMTQERDRL